MKGKGTQTPKSRENDFIVDQSQTPSFDRVRYLQG